MATSVSEAPGLSTFLLVSTISFLYLVYQWALPKPIPGIPYDESSRRSLLGSLPEITTYMRKGGRLRTWIQGHSVRHHSALTQIWLGPLSNPTLILADFRETQDILTRRTKEFDRGKKTLDFFRGPVGNHHIAMSTTDPRFKGNKELVKDLMTPAFLHQVSAPQIYAKAMSLVALWSVKAEAAKGRPFNARRDINDAALDIINAVTFGLDEDMSLIKQQLDSLESTNNPEIPTTSDGAVEFAEIPVPPAVAAMQNIGDHVGEQFKAMFPAFHHHYKVWTSPTLRKSIARKDKLIYDEIEKALPRLRSGEGTTLSAMDNVLQREMNAAAKAERPPNFHSPRIHDELFGYFIAGHDTSSTALSWMAKNLADYPATQTKLRNALKSAYAGALTEGRQPSATEIWKTQVPYLDAVLEESLRMDPPIPFTLRDAMYDTVLLGHPIPKNTTILIVVDGPDFKVPGLPMPGRDESSEASHGKRSHGRWDPEDMHLFRPERWLKTNEQGAEVYDSQAGPNLAFSAGPRGCFGRRLAYLETRIVLALLVWNFEFHALEGKLGSRESFDKITVNPVSCYVRLSKVF
ncbi:cytochrome P450 [Xylariomycetidae sp. FL2044]|nr:cytochrome P450 [Xylariomycetidae sp. FL2044]